jgi:putative YphP/YqiW family bacilliredoxin
MLVFVRYLQKKNKMPYPEELVAPMRVELVDKGFTELRTEAEVEEKLGNLKGSALLVVNSVCGCAAGSARPGAMKSLINDKTPDHLFTVFAGQDLDATDKAREFLLPYPPSSPSIGLFKDGELVHFVERHHIEGRTAEMIAGHLKEVYNHYL